MEAEKATSASSADVAKARQQIEEARVARILENGRLKHTSLTQEAIRLHFMAHVSQRIHGFLKFTEAGEDRHVRLRVVMEEYQQKETLGH